MSLNLTIATRYGLNVLALLGIAVALYLGSSIFIPLTIAGLLATILYPAAKWLNTTLRMPWFFACLSTILLLVVLHIALFSAIGLSVPQLINRLPTSEPAWQKKYEETALRLRASIPFLTKDMLPEKAEDSNFYKSVKQLFSPENVSHYLQKFAAFGAEQVSQLVLILFVILFLLLEAELLAKKVRAIFGTTLEHREAVAGALAEMAEAIRTYLVWRTIVNLGLAIILGVFYKFGIGLEQWYLWAVLTAVLSYVPYIGTIAAGVPPVLEALVFHDHPEVALIILFVYIMVVTVEGYLIVPWVMGRSMDLNATTVMLACLFWNLVWGVAGLFLAMPLMAAVKAVLLHVEDWRPWGELLSSVETDLPEKRHAEIARDAEAGDATVVMEGNGPTK
jgi:AI-2 transport protein TqsA